MPPSSGMTPRGQPVPWGLGTVQLSVDRPALILSLEQCGGRSSLRVRANSTGVASSGDELATVVVASLEGSVELGRRY